MKTAKGYHKGVYNGDMARHLDELGKIKLASEVYIVKDGRLLLFKRSAKAKRFPGYWIGPGGHIDEGEDAMLAALREVEEETGVRIETSDIKLKAVVIHHHLDREEVWVSSMFLATIPEQQAIKKNEREGKAKWWPLEEVKKLKSVFPPSAYYFEHVLGDRKGVMYTNIQWKDAKLVKVFSERVDRDS